MERLNLIKTLNRLGVLQIETIMKNSSMVAWPEGTNGLTWCGWENGVNYYVSFKK